MSTSCPDCVVFLEAESVKLREKVCELNNKLDAMTCNRDAQEERAIKAVMAFEGALQDVVRLTMELHQLKKGQGRVDAADIEELRKKEKSNGE